MKKILFLIIAVTICALCFVACTPEEGGNGNGGNGNNGGETSSVVSTEPSIKLPQDVVELYVGQTAKVTPSVNNVEGNIYWQTTDGYIASVDKDGLITAKHVGTATISVFSINASANLTVNVVEPKQNSSISFTTDSVSVDYYGNYKLTPVIVDCDGPFSWTSSDESVVKVDNEGNLTPVKIGQADVQVNGNGKGARIRVNVVSGEYLPTIEYDKKELNVLEGGTLAVKTTVRYNGKEVTGYTATYDIYDEAIASVDTNGVITGKKGGSTTMTVNVNYRGYNFPTETFTLNVKDDIDLRAGDSDVTLFTRDNAAQGCYSEKQLSVEVYEGGVKVNNASLTYTSADEAVATVSSSGKVKAVAKGETIINVTYVSTDGVTAIARINVSVERTVVKLDPVTVQIGSSDGSITGLTYLPLPAGVEGTVTAISADNGATTITLTNAGVVSVREMLNAFKANAKRYVEKGGLALYSDNGISYELTVDLATLVITDIEGLNKMSEYGLAHLTAHYGYYILDADIDGGDCPKALSGWCGGNSFTTNGFRGVFDGRGHTIKNITIGTNLFSGVGEDAVVKNFAFINPIQTTQSVYCFISELQGAYLENVYLELPTVSMINYVGSTSHIKNVIFKSTGGTGNVRMCQNLTDNSDVTDTIYIAEGFDASAPFGYGSNILRGCHVYASTADLIYDLMGNDYMAEWDGSFVYTNARVEYNGNKMFGVEMNVVYPNEVYANSSITIEAVAATFSLKASIAGVTINETTGELTVGDVAPDTVITVVVSSALDETLQEEVTVLVVLKPIDLTANGLYDIELGTAISISDVTGNVISVKTTAGDKTALSTANVITAAELNAAAGVDWSENLAITLYTANAAYSVNAAFITKIIRSYADLPATAATVTGYYVLGNDITFNNDTAYNMCGWGGDSSTGFRGVFDGRGHYLKNLLTAKGGMFYHLGGGGVVKNVAFIEPRFADNTEMNFVIASENHTGQLKDVYVYSTNAFLVAACDKGYFTGCVFNLTRADGYAFMSYASLPVGAYKGVVALTSKLERYSWNAPDNTRVNCYQYTTVSALKAALKAGNFPFETYFNATYWSYDFETGTITWLGSLPAGVALTDVSAS